MHDPICSPRMWVGPFISAKARVISGFILIGYQLNLIEHHNIEQ